MNKKKNIGFILSGGVGSRFGSDMPKQYCTLLGREVIAYTVDAFRASKQLDDFFVVVDENLINAQRVEDAYGVKCVAGGKTRNGSFQNALDHIAETFPDCEKIIENNAACPMITAELVDEFLGLLDDYDYVEAAYKITDALGSYKDRVANREDFYLIQAPDAYRFPLLRKHYNPDSPLGHPAHQLPPEAVGYRYFGYAHNIKITYPLDIEIAEVLMRNRARP